MRGLRLRKGRNLPEVIQLIRGELGFMLKTDLLGQASLPPSSSLCGGPGIRDAGAGSSSCGASTRKLPHLNAGNSLCLSLLSIPKWEFKKFWKDLIAQKGGFYTQKAVFSFSVTTTSDCEGVGEMYQALLGPNEHKQLGVQTTHSQGDAQMFLRPPRPYQGPPPSPAEL